MKTLVKFLFITFIIGYSLNSQAQEKKEEQDLSLPVKNMTDLKRKAPIFGTGFLYDNWSKGTVLLTDNRTFKNLDLMFDLNRQELSFKADNGETQVFTVPVKEFSITAPDNTYDKPRLFKKGFPRADGGSASTFYEVLIDDNTKLLRKIQAKEIDQPESGYTEKSVQIRQESSYYILSNNSLTKVKKDKKAILTILNNKADKIDEFITANKLDVKDDASIIQIVKYYNTL